MSRILTSQGCHLPVHPQESCPCDRGVTTSVRAALAPHALPSSAGCPLHMEDVLQVPQRRPGRPPGAHGLHRILLQERRGNRRRSLHFLHHFLVLLLFLVPLLVLPLLLHSERTAQSVNYSLISALPLVAIEPLCGMQFLITCDVVLYYCIIITFVAFALHLNGKL